MISSPSTPTTVLVTDGENRSSLAVTRSLGRFGCRVIVAGLNKKNLASSSRFCAASYLTTSPIDNAHKYLDDILDIIRQERIDFIYPMTEPVVMALAEHRDLLPAQTILAAPDLKQIKAVFDKYAVFQLAQQVGVAIPQTVFVHGRKDFSEKAATLTAFPVVVKPCMTNIPTKDGFLSTGVMYANTPEELNKLYQTTEALNFPSMIQEKIIGPGTGLFTLFDKNKHLALFSHKRLREKPPSGGVSVVSESIPLDPEMVAAAQKLLSAVGWQGVAMVEFKRDSRDGKAKLMEINGRFWGSLQLAVVCGIDFPTLLLGYLQGVNPPTALRGYILGHKLKWLLGTLDHLLIRLKNCDKTLNLPSNSPSKWQALVDFLRFTEKNTTFDVLDWNDPSPFFLEVRSYILNALKGY